MVLYSNIDGNEMEYDNKEYYLDCLLLFGGINTLFAIKTYHIFFSTSPSLKYL